MLKLQLDPPAVKNQGYRDNQHSLSPPSCLMTAASVLLVTHSSSLATPSGRAPRHRYRGSMMRFTSGMAHLQREQVVVSVSVKFKIKNDIITNKCGSEGLYQNRFSADFTSCFSLIEASARGPQMHLHHPL